MAHEVFGLTPAELLHVARTGVEAAFCSVELKRSLCDELDGVVVSG